MTYVSISRGIAFVHVPRNGGSSVRSILRSDDVPEPMSPHRRAKDVIEVIGRVEWDRLESIAVVRDPETWLRSVWRYARATPVHALHRWALVNDFSNFVRGYADHVESEWRSQTAWLVDDCDRIAVRHVLRFESLALDWSRLAVQLGIESELPRSNQSKAADSDEGLTADAAAALYATMREDYERFGYRPPVAVPALQAVARGPEFRTLQLSTFCRSGGAARAAVRLHRGLQRMGVESRMLVSAEAPPTDPTIAEVPPLADDVSRWRVIEKYWIADRRSELSNTWFSLGRPGIDLRDHPWVREADIVHLHWVSGFQSTDDIGQLLRSGKRVVWTLHDEWAYTGGCHFDAGCGRWRVGCRACPQLNADPLGIVDASFDDRLSHLSSGDLTLVCPSEWLAQRVRQSRVFRDRRVEVVPNGIDLGRFHPSLRAAGRTRLGASDADVLVLFAASDANERRKGFSAFAQAMDRCAADPRCAELVGQGRLVPVVLGVPAIWQSLLPRRELGVLADETSIVECIAAADMVVVPSFEDNLPNAAVEGLACGTPVVGFNSGGIPEIVGSDATRWLAPTGDIAALAERIATLANDAALRARLRVDARRRAEERFGESSHGLAMIRLYASLAEAPVRHTVG